MGVAEKFKSAKIAGLPIQPSAAYLLAAPSMPDETREKAVEKAEAGEEITFATAREMVAEARKKERPRRQKATAFAGDIERPPTHRRQKMLYRRKQFPPRTSVMRLTTTGRPCPLPSASPKNGSVGARLFRGHETFTPRQSHKCQSKRPCTMPTRQEATANLIHA